jgi:hypothetical protein
MIETKGRGALDLGRRHGSNFSISGKEMSTCDLPLAPLGDQLRQAVQGLRAEDDVDVGRAGDDRRAFLAGHAAADADHQVRIGALQVRTRPRSWKTFPAPFRAPSRC